MAHRDVPSKVLSNSENIYCGHTLLNQQVPNFGFKLRHEQSVLETNSWQVLRMNIGIASKNIAGSLNHKVGAFFFFRFCLLWLYHCDLCDEKTYIPC